jgi:hypothetical protein
MNATKLVLILFFLSSNFIFGQGSEYPKDTIFLKFKDTIFTNTKMKSKSIHNFQGKNGIKFWWKGKWMFYDKNRKADTLCYKHLKDYTFLSLKEIEKKEREYYKNRFGGNPWIKNKNGVFYTFLIEKISREKFVIYPVIWRNEGIIQ